MNILPAHSSPEPRSPLKVGAELEVYIAQHGVPMNDEFGGHIYPGNMSVAPGPSGAYHRAVVEALGGVVYDQGPYAGTAWFSSPERLAAVKAARNLPIHLESDARADFGAIYPVRYGVLVRRRLHPVSIANRVFLGHDTKPDDHAGTVIALDDALFDLYVGRYIDLIDLADLHDHFTGGNRSLGEALNSLAEGNMHRFNIIVDDNLPHLLGRREGPGVHNPELSLIIRRLASEGLDRLGVGHPNILELSGNSCMTCRLYSKLGSRATQAALYT